MHDAETGLTANQRFKNNSSQFTRLGLLGAVAIHLALFLLVQPFSVEDLSAAVDEDMRVVLPPIRLPEPPADIPRPSMPVVGDLELDLERTIAPTTREYLDNLPPTPPPIRTDSNTVRFIPYDTPPVLENRDDVARALRSEYPRSLREAGFEGRVLLWMYVDETGRVARAEVKESSGSDLLDEAALRVADGMLFTPARNRERVTAVWVQQWVTFRLR